MGGWFFGILYTKHWNFQDCIFSWVKVVASQTCLNLEWLWYYTCSYNRLLIHVYSYLFIYITVNIYKISFLGEEYLSYLQRVSNPFDLIKKYVQFNSTSYAYNEAKSPVTGASLYVLHCTSFCKLRSNRAWYIYSTNFLLDFFLISLIFLLKSKLIEIQRILPPLRSWCCNNAILITCLQWRSANRNSHQEKKQIVCRVCASI